MIKTNNPLLDPKEIERRLQALRDGFTSNAIEDNPLPQVEKDFLENLIKRGLTSDEISKEIDKEFSF